MELITIFSFCSFKKINLFIIFIVVVCFSTKTSCLSILREQNQYGNSFPGHEMKLSFPDYNVRIFTKHIEDKPKGQRCNDGETDGYPVNGNYRQANERNNNWNNFEDSEVGMPRQSHTHNQNQNTWSYSAPIWQSESNADKDILRMSEPRGIVSSNSHFVKVHKHPLGKTFISSHNSQKVIGLKKSTPIGFEEESFSHHMAPAHHFIPATNGPTTIQKNTHIHVHNGRDAEETDPNKHLKRPTGPNLPQQPSGAPFPDDLQPTNSPSAFAPNEEKFIEAVGGLTDSTNIPTSGRPKHGRYSHTDTYTNTENLPQFVYNQQHHEIKPMHSSNHFASNYRQTNEDEHKEAEHKTEDQNHKHIKRPTGPSTQQLPGQEFPADPTGGSALDDKSKHSRYSLGDRYINKNIASQAVYNQQHQPQPYHQQNFAQIPSFHQIRPSHSPAQMHLPSHLYSEQEVPSYHQVSPSNSHTPVHLHSNLYNTQEMPLYHQISPSLSPESTHPHSNLYNDHELPSFHHVNPSLSPESAHHHSNLYNDQELPSYHQVNPSLPYESTHLHSNLYNNQELPSFHEEGPSNSPTSMHIHPNLYNKQEIPTYHQVNPSDAPIPTHLHSDVYTEHENNNPVHFNLPQNHQQSFTHNTYKYRSNPESISEGKRWKRNEELVREKRKIANAVRLLTDPRTRLDVPQTLENIGTATRDIFEEEKSPIYHMRNALASAQDACACLLNMKPSGILIPSRYKIVNVEDGKDPELGSINPQLFRNNGQSPIVQPSYLTSNDQNYGSSDIINNYDDTMDRIGSILRDSVQWAHKTAEHAADAFHSARQAVDSAKKHWPKLLTPYMKAVEVVKPGKETGDIVGAAKNSEFVGVGKIMDYFGMTDRKTDISQPILGSPRQLTEEEIILNNAKETLGIPTYKQFLDEVKNQFAKFQKTEENLLLDNKNIGNENENVGRPLKLLPKLRIASPSRIPPNPKITLAKIKEQLRLRKAKADLDKFRHSLQPTKSLHATQNKIQPLKLSPKPLNLNLAKPAKTLPARLDKIDAFKLPAKPVNPALNLNNLRSKMVDPPKSLIVQSQIKRPSSLLSNLANRNSEIVGITRKPNIILQPTQSSKKLDNCKSNEDKQETPLERLRAKLLEKYQTMNNNTKNGDILGKALALIQNKKELIHNETDDENIGNYEKDSEIVGAKKDEQDDKNKEVLVQVIPVPIFTKEMKTPYMGLASKDDLNTYFKKMYSKSQ